MTDIDAIVTAVDGELESMARMVIERYLDMERSVNRSFRTDPDDRGHHQTHWHQWGIITHTRVFLQLYRDDVPRLLRKWDIFEGIDRSLQRTIDGVTRWKLLEVAILLHDIGKFAARTESKTGFHFWHHEKRSGEIISEHLNLGRFGLSTTQVDYIAMTAADHFVLGLVRKRAREVGHFNQKYTTSPQFRNLSAQIWNDHPKDFVEVGVLFLGDSLAKADPHEGPPQAVSQYEINVAVARAYLEQVLGMASL